MPEGIISLYENNDQFSINNQQKDKKEISSV
ncbi:hypothetical protein GFO_3500 [Christiangramia forsetii KT0803]|uniref:Uncharacterized protein n=1 Tax=Christiangramia forsetii (strain DSM 17595 / CGMCC 1.15422 / KT0803) TaxID=411154 RepID=A0M743_CHRFK|nr:hypothetical protein GFO_3500 [Christiangramia forsetii KT0803]